MLPLLTRDALVLLGSFHTAFFVCGALGNIAWLLYFCLVHSSGEPKGRASWRKLAAEEIEALFGTSWVQKPVGATAKNSLVRKSPGRRE